jgi:hypothetical protein
LLADIKVNSSEDSIASTNKQAEFGIVEDKAD